MNESTRATGIACLAFTCFCSVGAACAEYAREGRWLWFAGFLGSAIWGVSALIDYIETINEMRSRLLSYELEERLKQ